MIMWTAGKTSWADSSRPLALLALNLVGTVLVSYHIYVHDLSILFPAVAFVLEIRAFPPTDSTHEQGAVRLRGHPLLQPLYIVLTLRYRQLQVMAGVLLMVFLGLLSLVRTPPGQTAATG